MQQNSNFAFNDNIFLKKDKKSKKNDKKVLTNEKIFDILVLSIGKEKEYNEKVFKR